MFPFLFSHFFFYLFSLFLYVSLDGPIRILRRQSISSGVLVLVIFLTYSHCNYIEFMSFSQFYCKDRNMIPMVSGHPKSEKPLKVYTQIQSAKWWEGRVSNKKRKGKHNQV